MTMPKFSPLPPARNLTEELTATLAERIRSGELAASEKLPTEQEMIAAFGVSRTVVREAIAALRAEGLVESRQGAGVFVVGDKRRRPFRIESDGAETVEGVLAIMELRRSVEIEAAGLAAERRTEADLKAIHDAVEAFDAAIHNGDAVAADFQFHKAICEATANPYFASFLEFLGYHIIPRQTVRVQVSSSEEMTRYLQKVAREHHQIVTAIEARDGAAARRAMGRHLTRGRDRYASLVSSVES
ncbi:GntR family transcriptional regulator [Thalassobaculum fulvum]|uniref:GntR family transcriptional regulator n=1 Tax=Thalassobaculum fulvum TaxID=1633335 RepID=A0A918XR83_9PROT|nr:FadR/GntR family transcriptional regulator [Thalassobaculum fulvum]GHD45563.1 GntR family transcriptional regulator [Thalassobaculum fulvum]